MKKPPSPGSTARGFSSSDYEDSNTRNSFTDRRAPTQASNTPLSQLAVSLMRERKPPPGSAEENVAVDIADIAAISKGWDQKGDPQVVQVSLKSYQDHPYLDVRLFVYSVSRDKMVPTPKGVTVGMRQLPEFFRAIREAYSHAEALGLMKEASE